MCKNSPKRDKNKWKYYILFETLVLLETAVDDIGVAVDVVDDTFVGAVSVVHDAVFPTTENTMIKTTTVTVFMSSFNLFKVVLIHYTFLVVGISNQTGKLISLKKKNGRYTQVKIIAMWLIDLGRTLVNSADMKKTWLLII